jgi:hypothetical protein
MPLRAALRAALVLVLTAGLQAPSRAASVPDSAAGSGGFCGAGRPLSAEQKDVVLRFGAVIKGELEAADARVVLIARSGLDLRRFALRYSHAGISLRASPESPWAVRQLYYDCDERRPRLFDQGLSAFLLGGTDADLGHVSIVFLPAEAAAALERTALDDRLALQLLGGTYSANAYPFSVRYQNCNQWVAELMALAWGAGEDAGAPAAAGPEIRQQAQRWLRSAAYAPTVFDVGWVAATWAGAFVPWVRRDDHPADDRARHRYQVSMPDSIEAFVRQRLPGAQRLELCHDSRQVVLRRGWEPIGDGCRPAAGDTVLPLP